MRVIAAAETDAGICKPINQDGYCIKIAQTPAGQVALAAVCDGMGGLEKGELASATAVREFSAWFDQTLPGLLPELDWMRVSEMWRAMIHDVDVRLHEYGAAHGLELGTTVTAMLIYGGKYLIAHVGDTRVYEVGGVLRQLTEDHTVVEREVQAGLLTPEAAEPGSRGACCCGAWGRPTRCSRIFSAAIWMCTPATCSARTAFGTWCSRRSCGSTRVRIGC